ncbi:ATP-dependent DNA helicase RecQ [uncultured Polaribacter sp.]|uniref:RecQ family ATP-dependent DNA helicase n=1 Tax=uncultured Polaribacter sp. TaxID=174711 RepID=UPI002625BE87|nr:ATP-dependent DNA helicase RecQ [uncultured Polaribacter sp.]
MSTPHKILEKFWGYNTFRTPQEKIITAVLEKKDVIALLPTGGGKSLCFQIPALLQEGVCLVISPLIALMQDQVKNLTKKNIKATLIPSGISQNEQITLFDNIKFGNYKFLYISPERLQSQFIQQKIKELNVNLVAVDEAHCISEWGHDFRPSYRNIALLKELQPNANFIALTATANDKILDDISKNLKLKAPVIFKKSFFRANLAYQIFNIEDKLERIIQIFKKTKKPAIVYVNSRKKTVEIANFLNANNFKSSFYHAGLTPKEKQENFINWLTEKTPVIVATNAFGMGIDKTNVGLVIHYNLPASIENYVQETGRAGRNNKKSFGVLLYNANDVALHQQKTANTLPSLLEIKTVHKKLYQHFNIAKGELLERSFDFNFIEFCKKYNFPVLKVDVILKILVNYGILEMSSNYNKKITLTILSSHKAILNFSNNNRKIGHFLNILLRTYGGLFESETKIDEFLLAKKASITTTQVLKNLETLEQNNLIKYTPVTTESALTFLVPREDDYAINKFSKEMKLFLEQKKNKTTNFIAFVKNNKTCRSVLLLSYFGEISSENCGICDVCLKNKLAKKSITTKEILDLFNHKKQLSSKEICSQLKANKKPILIHLQTLIATDKLVINQQNKYQLKEK